MSGRLLDLDPLIADRRRGLVEGTFTPDDRFMVRTSDADGAYDKVRWTGPDGASYECDVKADVFEITPLVHGSV